MSTPIEHLRVAHHLALRAEHTSDYDAAALLRSWPVLTSAALLAHSRLAVSEHDPDRVVERVALDAEALRRAGESHIWPGQGRGDPALRNVTSALQSAGSAHGSVDPNLGAESARLITSTLWTTSRIVSSATSDFSFDLRHDYRNSNPRRDDLTSLSADAHRRLNAVEQMTAAALASPQLSREDATIGRQLRQAVAGWDIESHRALLGEQSTAVLHVLAHLEAESIKAVESMVARAPGKGLIDEVSAGRLLPVLRDSSKSWELLRDASAQLSFAATTVPMRFIDAARHLQDSFVGATGSTGLEDERCVVRALSGHLESSVTIAASACELIDNGELRAPARAIVRLLAERNQGSDHSLAAQIDPVAVLRRMTIPLDTDMRHLLRAPARQVFDNAHEAVRRASGLDLAYRTVPAFASPSNAELARSPRRAAPKSDAAGAQHAAPRY